jgi:hypothetical protein
MLSIVSLCANLIVPWLLFCGIFASMAFSIHYVSTGLAHGIVFAGYGLVILTFLLAHKVRLHNEDPKWYHFAGVAFFIAVTLGAILGDAVFHYYMKTFYDIENLNTYPSVNPLVEPGQQVMDVGRMYFTGGTHLDVQKTAAFKNSDVYCVTPITIGDDKDKLPSYDYWAVGMNCCSGEPGDYHCGEYDNPNARAGLRLMRDDQRPFFRLAIQQAEAKYKIKAQHPVLLFWVQDPIAEMNAYHEDGFRVYILGMLIYFFVNAFFVLSAALGFSKLGYNSPTVM